MEIPWYIYLIIIILQLLSAMFNALNIGLMGLDPRYLELMTQGPFESKDDEQNAQYAKKIYTLRRKGNSLLTMILLGTAASNAVISVLMADIEGDIKGFLLSTSIITVFGEIIPQTFANKYSLQISSFLRWPAHFFYYATFLFCYPIGAILDKILGEEAGNVLSKHQMKRMFEQYEKSKLLKPQERKILSAVLELKSKVIGQVMTPIDKAFMIDINVNLNQLLLKQIYSEGYSRIPVYDGQRENIVGLLMTRDLVLINLENSIVTIKQLSSILLRDIIAIDVETKLEPVLSYFKGNSTHMGLVTRKHKVIGSELSIMNIGIITLEDIVEEILQEEIEDERETQNLKGERKLLKNKLIYLFTNHKAKNQLNEAEILAICEFLHLKVDSFHTSMIEKDQLYHLISNCDIIDIESDAVPFSHIVNESNNFTRNQLTYLNEYQNSDQIQFDKHLQNMEITKGEEDQRKKQGGSSSFKAESQTIFENNAEEIELDDQMRQQQQQDDTLYTESKLFLNQRDVENLNTIEDYVYEEYYRVNDSLMGSVELRQKLKENIDPILYVRGVPASDFYLILQGDVLVCSGSEGFFIKLSSYDYLGLKALQENEYRPDFSAKVLNQAKLLKIKQSQYNKYVKFSDHPKIRV
ncbi:ancient conserved domain protein 2 [Stylonychia lemnae]|uniref:Ancient conserved domain protein 2 n=1 Tax=Stylonychia lemnae TaxID=5949 RepID=A0A077ZP29_STYLE|nr:ancient conserved domain protein 2 [Stylonychia lemnae]|eukprot:CDW71668.1 ancient conserved domain protein 2 [Stylonychia lemnae]